ncbi:hypothetical protein NHX12_024137, partial [Muraenolepis orangiensis]
PTARERSTNSSYHLPGYRGGYFVLDPESGQLQYYVSEQGKCQKPRGSLPLIGASVTPSDEAPHMFVVNSSGELYKLRASDAKEQQFWMSQLQACARRHSDSSAKVRKLKGSDEHLSVERARGSQEGLRHFAAQVATPTNIVTITHHKSPAAARRAKSQCPGRLQEVKEVMSQAEGQQKNLVHSIDSLPAKGPVSCLDQDLLLLKATSAATLSCLGECLNILQQSQGPPRSKASQPNHTILGAQSDGAPVWTAPRSPSGDHLKNGGPPTAPLRSAEPSPVLRKRGLSPGAEGLGSPDGSSCDQGLGSPDGSSCDQGLGSPDGSSCDQGLGSPDGSSCDQGLGSLMGRHVTRGLDPPMGRHVIRGLDPPMGRHVTRGLDPRWVVITWEKNDTSDHFRERRPFKALLIWGRFVVTVWTVEESPFLDATSTLKRSIILHLLSQLKLGMDLTRVVLPTFILEKRSLLEMYANFMAHPDMFLSITAGATPEDRMVRFVEYYLTAFHEGRKGAVAKKPYNPILGETFRCSWEVPRDKVKPLVRSSNQERSNQGRDPGTRAHANNSQQQGSVSHHPPVSGFYCECRERNMCVNAHVWTKSKFMGMSIGVSMVGEGVLCLLEHDEEYVFTLPSAYARSILTVPWVELGGKVSISCAKSGYSASVTFHTKPFYGGKVHRNGETKVMDTAKLPVIKKKLWPVDQQGRTESRRLWQHVTRSLKEGNMEEATEHKRHLEERQRGEEKQRAGSNTPWTPKYFTKEGEGWIYNNALWKSP